MTYAITVLGVAIIAAAIGDILMSKGMKEIGSVSIRHLNQIIPLAKRVFTCRHIINGLIAMAVYFASFATAMAWLDVSVVVPLTALSYVMTTAYSSLVMHEHVNTRRWGGVAIVTIGAVLIGISS